MSQNKGFGKSVQEKASKMQEKVNRRGKTASRPGQISRTELKKREEEQEEQAMAILDPEDDGKPQEIGVPEVVSNRMIGRISVFAGIPLLSGAVIFPLFYYFKVLADPPIDIPNWVATAATLFSTGGAAVGISYGILSSSWNPAQRGSALGFTEIRQNFPIFMQRFQPKK
eukprot:CAMPEP_0196590742 /NCGR_PEP_ID=MMETSP1081-20130531/67405_1 /TAXON_ID=36882 /ORGANISM="Pyramimonas amylifera, Strain CCMP720" /LENGTH=169 /DNA_ID=CAMNT_0041913925 /DNA_START=173 /DNA_END=682 /DNA_ORIENTATION=-